jgi:amidase
MQRRDFLKTSLVTGTAALSASCGVPPGPEQAPVGSDAPDLACGDWTPPAFEPAGATIVELQAAQAEGRWTARALTEAYFTRMDQLDSGGPRLSAVIERNPDALEIAAALDRERAQQGPRGPLHGIPVLLKDNIDTADRMHTSAGSLALAESIAPRDAFLVARLRDAGAVILGKANLSEWANFRSTRSTSGWSARGGQVRNPYALDRNPCGSSSGSAVAAAADLCAAAVGTETDGSIICPSRACGLVGLKPTVGLVSRAGIIPISATQDTAGPMARTVADAAALLGAMAGIDPADPATAASLGHAVVDYTAFLERDGLRGARLGVVRGMFGDNPQVARVMDQALADLARLGAEIVDPVVFPTQGQFDDAEYEVLLYEFKAGVDAYLAALGPAAPVKSLAEVIAFNERHRERQMPYFGQEILLAAQEKGPLTSPGYLEALARCRRMSTVEGIDAVMDGQRLDACIAPSGGPAHLTDLVNGDYSTGTGSSTFAAVSGYPHITVPAGDAFGLPIGLSFFGRAWSEPRLIAFAYAFEQATLHRQAPRFLSTLDIST